jgi:hypothetical protein
LGFTDANFLKTSRKHRSRVPYGTIADQGALMSQAEQFWWNWEINCAVAFATFLAVAVAIFGDWARAWFRSKCWPPALRLKLLSEKGLLEKINHPSQKREGAVVTIEQGRVEDARFYHVQIWNERRRLSPARDVQLLLTRIEEPGPGGLFKSRGMARSR